MKKYVLHFFQKMQKLLMLHQHVFSLFAAQQDIEKKDTTLPLLLPPHDKMLCSHNEIMEDGCHIVCEMCGEILEEKALVSENLCSLKQRRKKEISLFNNIPSISRLTWEIALKIHMEIMQNDNSRSMKKGIVLACVHFAAILNNESVCFNDIVKSTFFKPRKLSRGIAFVTKKLKKDSPYFIHNHNDIMVVNSLLKYLHFEKHLGAVNSLIQIVTNNSNLFNSSHYKSVVCGCIFVWLELIQQAPSLVEFSKRVNVSLMTVKKKFYEIKIILLRKTMRFIFFNLLQNCQRKPTGQKKKQHQNQNDLWNHAFKLVVENFSNSETLAVRNLKNQYLPIDDVTDICEWNILLDTVYHDSENSSLFLDVHLKNTSCTLPNIEFNFLKFDETNHTNGQQIMLKSIQNFIWP
jgi:transcription initiation factor TFIIIB Brf1 subunit/transcription initiation factor TFIIB